MLKLANRTTMDYLSGELNTVQDRIKVLYEDEKMPADNKKHELGFLLKKEDYIIAQMALAKNIIMPSIN